MCVLFSVHMFVCLSNITWIGSTAGQHARCLQIIHAIFLFVAAADTSPTVAHSQSHTQGKRSFEKYQLHALQFKLLLHAPTSLFSQL